MAGVSLTMDHLVVLMTEVLIIAHNFLHDDVQSDFREYLSAIFLSTRCQSHTFRLSTSVSPEAVRFKKSDLHTY